MEDLTKDDIEKLNSELQKCDPDKLATDSSSRTTIMEIIDRTGTQHAALAAYLHLQDRIKEGWKPFDLNHVLSIKLNPQ